MINLLKFAFAKSPPPPQPLPRSGHWPKDLPLLHFSKLDEDAWTLEDSFQGVLIMGENGSGKTSGSGQILARRFLENGFGGLVLCFKTDEADTWQQYLKDAGREKDGRFFSVNGPYRFNFLDYEAKTSGIDFADNIVTLLMDVASIQKRTEGAGPNADFWASQKKKLLKNAIQLLLLSQQPIELQSIYDLILTSAKRVAEVSTSAWQEKSLAWHLIEVAEALNLDAKELRRVQQYWLVERPAIPDKTRETIDADFTGMFDPLCRGKLGELLCTTSNISPDDIFNGAVVVVDIPVAHYREAGQHAALIWSQLFQRAVDRRTYCPPKDRPVFAWQDEAHYFSIDQDAKFQTTARSKGISVVRLTQNLPNFLDAYGRDGKHKVDTLLGNHATKIFHRNGDPTTNEWAASVIAKETQYRNSLSMSGNSMWSSSPSGSASVNEVEEFSCSPKEFIGLKNGGKKNNYIVEGILFQSGRLWKRDKRWLLCRFSQHQK